MEKVQGFVFSSQLFSQEKEDKTALLSGQKAGIETVTTVDQHFVGEPKAHVASSQRKDPHNHCS